jgi:hypothetical protein
MRGHGRSYSSEIYPVAILNFNEFKSSEFVYDVIRIVELGFEQSMAILR